MNRVANFSTAQFPVRTVARRRSSARSRLPFNLVDGGVAMVMLAAALICFSYYNQMHGKLSVARAEHQRVAAQISAVQIENERMAAEIQALKSSPDAIERAARQELGMIRPGELVFTVDAPARAR